MYNIILCILPKKVLKYFACQKLCSLVRFSRMHLSLREDLNLHVCFAYLFLLSSHSYACHQSEQLYADRRQRKIRSLMIKASRRYELCKRHL